MLTAQQFYDTVQHAIGDDPDSRLSLWHVLNSAGRKLVMESAWTWLCSEPTDIVAVADQPWIALPDDFDRLITVRIAERSYMTVVISSMIDIETYRSSPVIYTANLYYIYPLMNLLSKGASGGVPVRNRLEIYPTPTEDGTPTLTVTYMRKWVELDENDPSRVLNIPEEFTSALIYRARADAKILQDDEGAPKEEALYAEEVARLKKHDMEQSINRGLIRGGASDRGRKKRLVYGFTDVRFS